MIEWIITSSVLIIVIVALRHFLKGKISLRLQYALWALVLVRLLIPFSVGNTSLSVLNFTEEIVAEPEWQGSENTDANENLIQDSITVTPDVLGKNDSVQDNSGIISDSVIKNETVSKGDIDSPDVAPDRPSVELDRTDAVNGMPSADADKVEAAPDRPLVEPDRVDVVPGISNVVPDTSTEETESITTPSTNTENVKNIDWILLIKESVTYIWLAGMIIVGLIFALANLRFANGLEKGKVHMEDIDGYTLPVYFSKGAETPCMHGLIYPKIYVTAEAIKSEQVLKHVLEHESTHYRHGDHIWCVLRAVALAMHWYNPLVWLAAVLSRSDSELACDEGTIKRIGEDERAEYGRTLIGLTCQKKSGLFVAATTMTGSKKGIKERIVLIAKKPRMAVYTLVAVVFVAVLAVGCTFTGANNRKEMMKEAMEEANEEETTIEEPTPEEPTNTSDDSEKEDETTTIAEDIRETSGEALSYKWQIKEDTLFISGSGAIDRGNWYNQTFKHVIIEDGITSIEGDAFSGYKSMESLSLPDSITFIGDNAFKDCEKLLEIRFPAVEYVDLGASILKGTAWIAERQAESPFVILYEELIDGTAASGKIVIPDGIITISEEAFSNADNIEEVIIPEDVVTIGDRAFLDCDALTSVTILNRYSDIGEDIFAECDKFKAIRGNGQSNAKHYATQAGIPYEILITYEWKIEGDTLIFSGTQIVEQGDWCDKEFKHVIIEEGITEISSSAIEYLREIESISFPSTYKIVAGFARFANLKEVTFAEGVEWIEEAAFGRCTSLERIVFPDSIDQIMLWAFEGCSNLKEVVLPETFTHFGSEAFTGTPWLESLKADSPFAIVNGVIIGVNDKLAVGAIVIPDGVTMIDTTEFNGNKAITSVTIPESVTYIDGGIFYPSLNPNLKVIYGARGSYAEAYANEIGITFETIKDYVWHLEGDTIIFTGKGTLGKGSWVNEDFKYVIIEEGIKYIEKETFRDRTNLRKVVFPSSIISIDDRAFENCINLEEVEIPSNVTGIGGLAFKGTEWGEGNGANDPFVIVNGILLNGSSAIGSIEIPSEVTRIGKEAFYFAEKIMHISIPESVVSIDGHAFSNCSALTSITIPDSVVNIADDAFKECNTLRVIYGKVGSVAEACANKLGVRFVDIDKEAISLGLASHIFERYNLINGANITLTEKNTYETYYISDSSYIECIALWLNRYSWTPLLFKPDTSLSKYYIDIQNIEGTGTIRVYEGGYGIMEIYDGKSYSYWRAGLANMKWNSFAEDMHRLYDLLQVEDMEEGTFSYYKEVDAMLKAFANTHYMNRLMDLAPGNAYAIYDYEVKDYGISSISEDGKKVICWLDYHYRRSNSKSEYMFTYHSSSYSSSSEITTKKMVIFENQGDNVWNYKVLPGLE